MAPNLRERVARVDIPIMELAEATGYHASVFSHWQAGRREVRAAALPVIEEAVEKAESEVLKLAATLCTEHGKPGLGDDLLALAESIR